jgi:hypothetical protein
MKQYIVLDCMTVVVEDFMIIGHYGWLDDGSKRNSKMMQGV